jgi:hypothetical protein
LTTPWQLGEWILTDEEAAQLDEIASRKEGPGVITRQFTPMKVMDADEVRELFARNGVVLK